MQNTAGGLNNLDLLLLQKLLRESTLANPKVREFQGVAGAGLLLRRVRGQSMVEFAIATPFLFLILAAVLFFGRYFFLAQILLNASQEGAKAASATANLSDENRRDLLRGFTTGGTEANPNSVIYAAFAAANLLSQGNSGDLPTNAKVEILPWDSDGSAGDTIPAGTVGVRIDYPFQLLGSPFAGTTQNLSVAMSFSGSGVTFSNFTITQRAVSAEQIYQQ